jgi:hypothetical protein
MKIYHKQLNSVKELRREQKRLKKRKAEAERKAAESKTAETSSGFDAGMLGSLIGAKSIPEVLAAVGMPIAKRVLAKTGKGILKKVAKEVLGGYLKWKAIDTGINLAMRFIRRQKQKAEEKQERTNAHARQQ